MQNFNLTAIIATAEFTLLGQITRFYFRHSAILRPHIENKCLKAARALQAVQATATRTMYGPARSRAARVITLTI